MWLTLIKGFLPFARYIAAPVAIVLVVLYVGNQVENLIDQWAKNEAELERLRSQNVALALELNAREQRALEQRKQIGKLNNAMAKAQRESQEIKRRFRERDFERAISEKPSLTEGQINESVVSLFEQIEFIANERHR